MTSPITDFDDKVAVITGGASGVGRALGRRLLARGAHVVLADVEQKALDATVAELQPGASTDVSAVVTDVTDPASVEALAEQVFSRYGRANLVFNNAGVGSPSVRVWETTPNDWAWVHAVNVYGVAYGIQSFVPRMLESGQPGYVVNTTSGDGAIAPLPGASVYASSKAAVAITTECLAANLAEVEANIGAGLLFPSGAGLISTGMWTPERNRHERWAREKERPEIAPEIQAMKDRAKEAAEQNRDHFEGELDKLADAVLDGIVEGRYVLTMGDFDGSVTRLHERAERYGKLLSPLGDGGH